MRRPTRTCPPTSAIVAGSLAVATVLSAPPAAAEPAPFERLPMTCSGLGTVETTAPGDWARSGRLPVGAADEHCTFDVSFGIAGTRFRLVGFVDGFVVGRPVPDGAASTAQ